MAINGIIGPGGSLFGQAVQNLNTQLTNLSTQLATGEKSSTYSGMGVDEGFSIAARSQLASISAFADTMTNVTTTINVANTALQSLSNITGQVQSEAGTGPQDISSSGQTIGQQSAFAELSAIVGILNTQAGDRFIFSGSAINTPSVASSDNILNGNGTQAGLKQVIAERAQADGTTGLGRLVITQPIPTSVSVAEDVAGSPFGLKLSSVSSSLTGATVTGPSGSPAGVSINLGAANPNPGDQVGLIFNLPDGTTASVQLTASSATPPPTGSFAIGATPTATAANLTAALNTAIGTLANTTLVAASAVEAGHNFFDPAGSASGSVASNKAAPVAPISGATALSGAAGTDSLSTNFAAGDTITVNGTPITFVASGATGNQLNVTDSVQTLLSKIDSITGTSTPSTISGGAVTLHGGNGTNLTVTSSNTAAFASLGFGATVTGSPAPLRVGGPPFNTATSLVAGTAANTVSWYTGETGTDPARGTAVARVDASITVQYGARADEQAFVHQLQNIAVYAAVTTNAANPNASGQSTALSQRIGANLAQQPGQQSIQDIQAEFAGAQTAIKATTDRQTQLKSMAQTMLDSIEGVSTDEVATKILALQTTLQASYQTTAMLYQTTLSKYLPA